jgi:protein-L-isoaspartate(D-aspartate) O-methyltransferase
VTSHRPAVEAALAAVDEDHFVRRADGSLVAQSSSANVIADLLDRLDIRPGMAVLEVGTGSGFSTALLAELVGPSGRVVSLDVIPELVERAGELLAGRGSGNTTTICRDGAGGASEHAPFDRIIAWTTAMHLPAAWVRQAGRGARIVAPVVLSTLSKTGAGVVIEIDDRGEPVPVALVGARFVEMHDEVLTQWLVPPYGADVLRRDSEGRPWWLSAELFREPGRGSDGDVLLGRLAEQGRAKTGPLGAEESADGFRAWLLAIRPAGLCSAALGDPDWRIGLVGSGAALMSTRDGTDTVTVGDTSQYDALAACAERWRLAGRPGLPDLVTTLIPYPDGWLVRAELSEHLWSC